MNILKLLFPIVFSTLIFITTGCGTKGNESYVAGVQLFQEKKYNECVPKFQQTVQENPEFGEAYMFMGRAYNSLQQYDLSIDSYQKALGIFKQGKYNASVDNLPNDRKVKQIEEVWLPYSQIQQKIQKGIPLTDIEIQKQEEIIKKLDLK